MATLIRPEISTKNKYYIDKHRYYELKHFCLQYNSWKKSYNALSELIVSTTFERVPSSNEISDLTAKCAINRTMYGDKINLIERAALDADEDLYQYILKAVTEGLSYTYLKTKLNMPCGRDMYYDRYRRFFWLLNNLRG